MTRIHSHRLTLLVGLSLVSFFSFSAGSPLHAGSYFQVFERAQLSPDADDVPPFAIMHPIGYDGSGGTLTVRVCVQPGSEELITPTQSAIAMWNALTPTTENCTGCFLWEEPPPPEGLQDPLTTLVHELGHCAMGLDHVNLAEDDQAFTAPPPKTAGSYRVGSCDVNQNGVCGEETSFTTNFNVTRVLSSAVPPGDNVLGDSEDMHTNDCPTLQSLGDPLTPVPIQNAAFSVPPESTTSCLLGLGCPTFPVCCPPCPSDCPSVPWQLGDISFFRVSDNNPFVIDATVIDKDTYSRNDVNLPTGHNYAASANRAVGELLGFQDTQSVMYSLARDGTKFSGLTADDVNMAKMGMTGADRDAGTADDYTIQLVFENDCASADIEVQLDNEWIDPDPDNISLGVCVADLMDSFAQPPQQRFHHTLIPVSLETRIVVELNPNVVWEFDLIFGSGFETGDLSEWSSSTP